jgi:diacylglycerol kinase family enzyme
VDHHYGEEFHQIITNNQISDSKIDVSIVEPISIETVIFIVCKLVYPGFDKVVEDKNSKSAQGCDDEKTKLLF